jgi:flagellin-like hook-associated protein FlgL
MQATSADEATREQMSIEFQMLLTGYNSEKSELQHILDNVKYGDTQLLSESTTSAKITLNSIADAVYSDGVTDPLVELGAQPVDTFLKTTTPVGSAKIIEIELDAALPAAPSKGTPFYIDAYDERNDTHLYEELLVVGQNGTGLGTNGNEILAVRLDGNITSGTQNKQAAFDALVLDPVDPNFTGDYVRIYQLPTTTLGDTRNAHVETDASFDFSGVDHKVYTDLNIGVIFNSTQTGIAKEEPSLQSVQIRHDDTGIGDETKPFELADYIEGQIEALGGEYRAGGKYHIDVEPVAKVYVVTGAAPDFTTGNDVEFLGWRPLTATIMKDSLDLLNVGPPAIGTVVADIAAGSNAISADGVKLRFTTTESMNQNYRPRIGVDDKRLPDIPATDPRNFSLFANYLKSDGKKGNDQFDIELDGIDFRADLDVVANDIEAKGNTDTPKSIDTILYEVWEKTDQSGTYGNVDALGNGIHKAAYAGVNLKNLLQRGINDNRPGILGNQMTTVSYDILDGKFTIQSSTRGRSSTVEIGSDVWTSTEYSLHSVKDAFGLIEGKSDTGTGSDFTFVFSGADDTYSITLDTFGLTNLGADDIDLSGLDVGSQPAALQAVDVLEHAIESINKSQTKIGTAVNHMTRRVDLLDAYSEHIAEHKARIEEIDFAAETQKLASLQILLQSGTASLAQANIIPQTLLQLLA